MVGAFAGLTTFFSLLPGFTVLFRIFSAEPLPLGFPGQPMPYGALGAEVQRGGPGVRQM